MSELGQLTTGARQEVRVLVLVTVVREVVAAAPAHSRTLDCFAGVREGMVGI